jgi:uncharacterized repeat protein (TIGR01451 family)
VVTPISSIGIEASPSVVADFNNDGFMDVATGNSTSSTISVALGDGAGHFSSVQNIDAPSRPHGIVALDVDGDGDLDLVVAAENGNALRLYINNGSGVFGDGDDFEVDSYPKYGLGAGDMNGDGIIDLVAGTASNTQTNKIIVLLGNGDGTFTESQRINSGGYSWKLALGDVNNDGLLDVSQANGPDNNASILFGNGDGTVQAAQIYTINGTGVGSSLGDLDGDGWLDWVISSYTASRWYVMHNNGDGTFTRVSTIPAPENASCASLYDFDNNGTLDMALADEVSDEIVLMKNDGSTSALHADVAVALAAEPQQYTPGQSLTYTLTVTNSGPDPSNGTTVSDAFPSTLSGVTWTCQASGGATCPAPGSGNINASVDLPSGGAVVFTASGTVAANATGTIVDHATATAGAPATDPNTANNTASVSTDPVPTHADVAVALLASPQQYTRGQPLTYTLTVTNDGPDASNGTQVSDNFPSSLSGVTWTCVASGGASCPSSGNGDLDASVDLPSGGTVVFTATGTVRSNTTGTIEDQATATVNAPTIDPNTANNTATVDTAQAATTDEIFRNGFDPG